MRTPWWRRLWWRVVGKPVDWSAVLDEAVERFGEEAVDRRRKRGWFP